MVIGLAYLVPALSVAAASLASPLLRFHIPLIKPDIPAKRIRLVTLWRCPSHDRAAGGDTLARCDQARLWVQV